MIILMPFGHAHWYGEDRSDLIRFKKLTYISSSRPAAVYRRDGHIYKILSCYESEFKENNEAKLAKTMADLNIGPAIFEVKFYYEYDILGIEMQEYPYELLKYLNNPNTNNITSEEISRIEGLIHQILWLTATNGYLLSDIKANNIVYDKTQAQVKLIDFEPEYCKYIGPCSDIQSELLLSIMMILLRFFCNKYIDNNVLFKELHTGKIGIRAESWKNMSILSIAATCIRDTPKLSYILLHYQDGCLSTRRKLNEIIDQGTPILDTPEWLWFCKIHNELAPFLFLIKEKFEEDD